MKSMVAKHGKLGGMSWTQDHDWCVWSFLPKLDHGRGQSAERLIVEGSAVQGKAVGIGRQPSAGGLSSPALGG